MAFNTFIYTTVLFLSIYNVDAQLQLVNGKIKISVVTTSGCGDTVNFINTQLADAYAEYKEFLEIEFVPWGRTVLNTDGSMTCQFGVNDCWANRLHRCVLHALEGNQDAQMSYMSCEFTSPYPSYLQTSYACASTTGLNLVDLDYCVSTSGVELDLAARDAAQEPMAVINFVPAIVFNDNIDTSLHSEARTRLKSMICFALAEDSSTGVTSCSI